MNAQSEASGSDPVGSAAEEALRLLGALSGWTSERVGAASEHLATGSAECTFCPLCRTVHAMREVSPEVRDHLVAAGASLMQAFAGIVSAATAATSRPAPQSSSPDVERIHVEPGSGQQSESQSETEWPDL